MIRGYGAYFTAPNNERLRRGRSGKPAVRGYGGCGSGCRGMGAVDARPSLRLASVPMRMVSPTIAVVRSGDATPAAWQNGGGTSPPTPTPNGGNGGTEQQGWWGRQTTVTKAGIIGGGVMMLGAIVYLAV